MVYCSVFQCMKTLLKAAVSSLHMWWVRVSNTVSVTNRLVSNRVSVGNRVRVSNWVRVNNIEWNSDTALNVIVRGLSIMVDPKTPYRMALPSIYCMFCMKKSIKCLPHEFSFLQITSRVWYCLFPNPYFFYSKIEVIESILILNIV